MSENDDVFAGTSARSTKHSAREDDELKHEVEGMVRAGRSTHAEEWNDPEPVAEGEPDVDSSPADTLVGGVPVGMSPDAVVARAELARWLVRADFPNTGAVLVEAARDHRAPDAVADELSRLPADEVYERVGDVVRALGYPTET
ncbi:Protein of unknown function [Modestobacter sp. DSM 44400]|uniref:DUF2795 domain-containing protein n=1 Tax=Modestobacter sp. DSM 44400 TaxID=1550230 RepID=UPI00089B8E86|nr:DUF2795 domain-containing protein [Modestobacter sp. DSM 44400]SDY54519.1 Protein of unknown function [Modestobacter sp. DSM 44400]